MDDYEVSMDELIAGEETDFGMLSPDGDVFGCESAPPSPNAVRVCAASSQPLRSRNLFCRLRKRKQRCRSSQPRLTSAQLHT